MATRSPTRNAAIRQGGGGGGKAERGRGKGRGSGSPGRQVSLSRGAAGRERREGVCDWEKRGKGTGRGEKKQGIVRE